MSLTSCEGSSRNTKIDIGNLAIDWYWYVSFTLPRLFLLILLRCRVLCISFSVLHLLLTTRRHFQFWYLLKPRTLLNPASLVIVDSSSQPIGSQPTIVRLKSMNITIINNVNTLTSWSRPGYCALHLTSSNHPVFLHTKNQSDEPLPHIHLSMKEISKNAIQGLLTWQVPRI